jgi:hypothetical protein
MSMIVYGSWPLQGLGLAHNMHANLASLRSCYKWVVVKGMYSTMVSDRHHWPSLNIVFKTKVRSYGSYILLLSPQLGMDATHGCCVMLWSMLKMKKYFASLSKVGAQVNVVSNLPNTEP